MDGIPIEAWAAMAAGRGALLELFNECWRTETFPEDWKDAKVIGIFKKGAADGPANYRPISLLHTAYTLLFAGSWRQG